MNKLYEFPSGLKLVYAPNSAVRSVAIGINVGAGCVHENMENSGISHFIEHMVFKGTKTRTAFDIVSEIDSIGAKINAFTTKQYTCFYTVSLKSHADKCFEILSDIYHNPTFLSEELEKERRVVLEEIAESEDTPDDVCLEKLGSAFFGSHPLGKTILGTKESLNNMTPDSLFSYKERIYTTQNTVVSVAGDISFEDAKKLVESYFETKVSSPFEIEFVPAAVPNNVFVSSKKDITQTHIGIAFPSVALEHKLESAVDLLANVFGMEMSSRLFQRVREQLGLCYTIYAYPSYYLKEGAFVIYVATNNESVEKAVHAIKDEILLLLDKGITDAELKKGKEQLATGLVLGQESTVAMMRAYGKFALLCGKLFDMDKKVADIEALTKDDIMEAARYIFDFDKAAASYVSGGKAVNVLDILKN